MRPFAARFACLLTALAGCQQPRTDVPIDASVVAAAPVPAPQPPEARPPKRIFARKFVSKVRMSANLDAPQIGYLRAGTVLTATSAEPVGHDRCRRGWYEIAETGGFVCDGREVTAFEGDAYPDRVPTRADRGAPLPYRYAYNRGQATPMYKRLPTEEEALFWEDGVVPPDAAVPELVEAEVEDPGDPEPQEPPKPKTLADLAGERGALVRRRLARGFHVSLDREFEVGRRRYVRSMSNGYIPAARMVEVESSAFRGVADPEMPIAFVILKDGAQKQRMNARAKPIAAGVLPYHAWFAVRGEETVRGKSFFVTDDGSLVQKDHAVLVNVPAAPSGVEAATRWLDLDLGRQLLLAMEGERVAYATLVSTGRVRSDHNPLLNHETPTGSYRILSKHVSATMDGDHAIFGAYSLEDVPFVQFFKGAFALHGAFWHDKFGRPASHGCVNLAPEDARFLFDWTLPQVPAAFHGAYPKLGEQGTLLVIHGATPHG